MKTSCNSCQSAFFLDGSLVELTGTRLKCSKCQEVFKIYPSESIDQRKHTRVKTNRACSILFYAIITACCNAEKLKVTQKYCVCGDRSPKKRHF
jgi:predicted Zn finger-like uncharacterized protein